MCPFFGSTPAVILEQDFKVSVDLLQTDKDFNLNQKYDEARIIQVLETTSSILSTPDSVIGSISSNLETKIIFLDVDGVLNHPHSNEDITVVCPKCVNKLKIMMDQTLAKIVISSSWRLNKRNKKTLFRYLRAMGVNESVVVGETRDLRNDGKTRAEEINDWLSNPNLYQSKHKNTYVNRWQVSSWVSLDDMDLASIQPNEQAKVKHIMLDPKLGLCGTKNIVAAVVQRLGSERVTYTYQNDGPFLKAPTKTFKRSAERSKPFYDDYWKPRLGQSASDLLSFSAAPEVESVSIANDSCTYESWGNSSVERDEPILYSETDSSIDLSQKGDNINSEFSKFSCLTLYSELSRTA